MRTNHKTHELGCQPRLRANGSSTVKSEVPAGGGERLRRVLQGKPAKPESDLRDPRDVGTLRSRLEETRGQQASSRLLRQRSAVREYETDQDVPLATEVQPRLLASL